PTLSPIGEQKVRHSIVGHVEVQKPVIVDVGGHHSPCLRQGLRDSRFPAYIGEGAVAVVVKQPARHWVVDGGNAVVPLSAENIAAELQLGFAVIHKTADK